tara:strand:+ start:1798 stop:3954 length:2157 start_codon:yes stop_codon:yes gene_type:complete
MKIKKNIFLLGTLFLLFSNNINAQSFQRDYIIRVGEETGGEYLGGNSGGLILDDLNQAKSANTGDEVIEDIRFGYNINDALYSQSLIEKAMKAKQDEWFHRQNDLLEKEIEKQLGKQYPNFLEAQKAFFKNLEKENVLKNNNKVNEKYSEKIKAGDNISKQNIKDFKLLEIRENELINGILNTQYEYLQYQGIPLNQITDLNQIETFKNNIISNLKNNERLLFNDKKTYSYLIHEITRKELNNNTNHPILIALLTEQLQAYEKFYIPSLNRYWGRTKWEQLNLMQAFLNKVRFSMSLGSGSSYMYDFANEKFIEDFAINNRDKTPSIFGANTNVYSIAQEILDAQGAATFIEALQLAYNERDRILRQQENAINNLLNSVNTDDVAIENAQNELDDLTKDIPWRASRGKINNMNNLEYYESYVNGSAPAHFKLLDGSHVVTSFEPLNMSKLGDTFESQFRDNIGFGQNEKYYYIKTAGTDQWSVLLFDIKDLKRELELMFYLGAKELGTIIGTYVIPVEDIKILITGKDFAGQPTSRWLAAGMLLVEVVPGGKVFKLVKIIPSSIFSGSGKFLKKIIKVNGGSTKLVYSVIDGVVTFGNRTQLAHVIGTLGTGHHAHHIIPWDSASLDLVQKAAKAEKHFHLNEILNGVPRLPGAHLTGHSIYNERVLNIIRSIHNSNPNMSYDDAYREIANFAEYLKDLIQRNNHLDSGQIANLIQWP